MPGFCGCGVKKRTSGAVPPTVGKKKKKSLQLRVKTLHYPIPRFNLTYTHNSISDITVILEEVKPTLVFKYKIHLQKKIQLKPILIKLLLSSSLSLSFTYFLTKYCYCPGAALPKGLKVAVTNVEMGVNILLETSCVLIVPSAKKHQLQN